MMAELTSQSVSSRSRKTFKSGDMFWSNFMNFTINLYPDQKKFWKQASPTETCSFCQGVGGVLAKCKGCRLKFHPLCAHENKVTAIFLNESCSLSVECRDHYKPILFCSCREPYDEKKPMIRCEGCYEWYHCSCIRSHVRMKELDDELNYICKSCVKLDSEGKSSLCEDKKKENIEKECKENWRLDASKLLDHVKMLVKKVCPTIDKIEDLKLFRESGVKPSKPSYFLTESEVRESFLLLQSITDGLERDARLHRGIQPQSSEEQNNVGAEKSIPINADSSPQSYDDLESPVLTIEEQRLNIFVKTVKILGMDELFQTWNDAVRKEIEAIEQWISTYTKIADQICVVFIDLLRENNSLTTRGSCLSNGQVELQQQRKLDEDEIVDRSILEFTSPSTSLANTDTKSQQNLKSTSSSTYCQLRIIQMIKDYSVILQESTEDDQDSLPLYKSGQVTNGADIELLKTFLTLVDQIEDLETPAEKLFIISKDSDGHGYFLNAVLWVRETVKASKMERIIVVIRICPGRHSFTVSSFVAKFAILSSTTTPLPLLVNQCLLCVCRL